MDKKLILAIISICLGSTAIFFGVVNFLNGRIATLSGKISTGLNIISHCGLTPSIFNKTFGILLQAQQILNIQNNYDGASKLYNSIYPTLSNCQPLLQIQEPTIQTTLMVLIGIILILFVVKKIIWF